jgi:outer membrane autotransporter protein
LGHFQQLSQRDFNRGFSSLSQESYQPFATATLNTLQRYSGVLHTRLNMMRAAFRGMPLAETVDRTELAQEAYLAQFGFTPLTLDLFDRRAARPAAFQSGFWLSGFGNSMGRSDGGGYSGFNHQTSGIPVGFDFRLADRFIVGVAATQSHGILSVQDNRGEGRSTGAMTTVYGSYFTDNAELEGMFTYGRDSYQSIRGIDFADLSRDARSEQDNDIFAARVEGRYHFNLDALKIEPFASMQYGHVGVGGFRERGAGDLGLIVGQHSVNALASQLGFRFIRPMNFGAGTLIPELTAAWQHDFSVGDNSIPASFRGAAQARFNIARPDDSGSALNLGGALTFIGNGNFSAAAGANATVGKSKPEASGVLQLQVRW